MPSSLFTEGLELVFVENISISLMTAQNKSNFPKIDISTKSNCLLGHLLPNFSLLFYIGPGRLLII